MTIRLSRKYARIADNEIIHHLASNYLGRKLICRTGGALPFSSRGRRSVRSKARVTALSHSAFPLLRVMAILVISPSAAVTMVTRASGFPSIGAWTTMLLLMARTTLGPYGSDARFEDGVLIDEGGALVVQAASMTSANVVMMNRMAGCLLKRGLTPALTGGSPRSGLTSC